MLLQIKKNQIQNDTGIYAMNADLNKYLLLFSDQADLSSQSRMWINLNENTISASAQFYQTIEFRWI